MVNSKIEWTDHTANLWWGCSKVHAGCDNCYAETLSNRFGNNIWGPDKPRKEVASVWDNLTKMQKNAAAAGEMHTVFVGSMMDIFEKPMPVVDAKGNAYNEIFNTDNLRFWLLHQIDEGHFPNLIFLLLTKRPSNINKYILPYWIENPPANVMFGTSVSDQETANKLIPQLLQVKGKKFLSVEPMLGPIDFLKVPTNIAEHYKTIDWVIAGGESGHGKRPFNPDWARTIRDQCKSAGVPFFMKQWDKVQQIPDDLMIRQFPSFFNKG